MKKKVSVVVVVGFSFFVGGEEASAQWWGPLVEKRANAAIRGSLQVNNPQAYKAWLAAQRSVPQNFYRGGNPYGAYRPYGYPRARDPWREAYQADLAWRRSLPPNGGKQRQQPRPPRGGNPEMPPWGADDPGVNSPDSPAEGYQPLREEDGKVISRPPVPTNQPLPLPF